MSDSARNPDFSELWRNHVSKVYQSKTLDSKKGQQAPGTSFMCNGLLSPRLRSSSSRYSNLNNGDSPGEVEISQDIIWDSTSPTQTGSNNRNTRVIEISDIVNRIAPKNIKSRENDSSLLHWIDDGTIVCTPEIPKSRVRKRSSRQSNVEDLMKLARQFDENMQQDKETSEQLNAVNNNLHGTVSISETKLASSSESNVKDLKCPSSLDQAEVELHALFDCSTQGTSGRFSEGSVNLGSAEHQQPKLKPDEKPGSSVHPAEQKETCSYTTNNCVDFDDDWENDDLLNDSFILAITQNPNECLNVNPKTAQESHTQTNTKFTSVCKPMTNTYSAHQPADKVCKMSCSSLQELYPKPKTTHRSTFKLEPNPRFQPKVTKDVSKSTFTVLHPKSKMADENPKTLSAAKPDIVTNDQAGVSSGQDFSDSLWDDGEDDALLYQICDNVERISNSQPKEVNQNNCKKNQEMAKTTKLLPIDAMQSLHSGVSTNRRSSGSFVRSNSLPGTTCEANYRYQGWKVPMKGANNKSGMSQSFPECHVSLGTYDQSRTFQAGNGDMECKPQTLMGGRPQESKSQHAAFKRDVSDSAIISNKAPVFGRIAVKCSAAEIERKKQEALARKRLRMQNTPKP